LRRAPQAVPVRSLAKEGMLAMRGMRPEDAYELTGVADPRVSPDGSTVAFVVWTVDREANDYRSAVFVAPANSSAPPRQVTAGDKHDADPRWSPDGRFLSFTSDRGEDREGEKRKKQLYVLPVGDPGEPRRLTDLDENVEHPAWSSDGTRIAFSARVPDPPQQERDERKRPPRRIRRLQFKLDDQGWTVDRPHHLFVVAADGSEAPRQLTSGDYEDTRPAWSPDGTRIAFASARHEDWDLTSISDVYIVDASGGEPERLTGMDGESGSPSWSPDGSRIAYLFSPGVFDEPRHGQIAVVEVATGERTVLTASLDRNCRPYPEIREPVWDGDSLLFAIEDRGTVPLYRAAADRAARPEPVVGGQFCVTGFDAAGGQIVHALSTPTSLSELYSEGRKLTDVGSRFTEARELCAPDRFVAVSPDGAEIEAWMMRPAGFEEGRTYPLLLNIHGGPFAQYAERFFDEFQVYAGAGYAVAYANPRGSSGYSEEWGRAIRGPVEGGPGFGSVDFEDLMAVVDEAVKRFDFLDPDRMGVMGGSYGGYMTSWIVGHTDRFRCAVSERSANNLAALDASSDLATLFKGYVGAAFWEAPEEYRSISPVTYAKDITTPLLILHSENDLRCPVNQAEELFAVLRSFKREVELVRFDAESHELTRSGNPTHRVMRFEIILEWLGRHLSG
jgi:dipeptidyl aminopeptidase/acylaminoacyl peptidase